MDDGTFEGGARAEAGRTPAFVSHSAAGVGGGGRSRQQAEAQSPGHDQDVQDLHQRRSATAAAEGPPEGGAGCRPTWAR
ncbi:hypothetical protein LRS10_12860 [Phenylobacterium sp. J426]|uniref:hypothetical protein n=1 Tax=Phenylobacterium sp. J426 TaxID=2898439 RepID=UPI0021511348|nr:hypothetical protein [Phenylobacterium sp. J426]MCR5874990.1 hypothetical protein [Phenylobacterium sp. J426]